jgi:hypothetical protein
LKETTFLFSRLLNKIRTTVHQDEGFPGKRGVGAAAPFNGRKTAPASHLPNKDILEYKGDQKMG